jgi:hypothetical protein
MMEARREAPGARLGTAVAAAHRAVQGKMGRAHEQLTAMVTPLRRHVAGASVTARQRNAGGGGGPCMANISMASSGAGAGAGAGAGGDDFSDGQHPDPIRRRRGAGARARAQRGGDGDGGGGGSEDGMRANGSGIQFMSGGEEQEGNRPILISSIDFSGRVGHLESYKAILVPNSTTWMYSSARHIASDDT